MLLDSAIHSRCLLLFAAVDWSYYNKLLRSSYIDLNATNFPNKFINQPSEIIYIIIPLTLTLTLTLSKNNNKKKPKILFFYYIFYIYPGFMIWFDFVSFLLYCNITTTTSIVLLLHNSCFFSSIFLYIFLLSRQRLNKNIYNNKILRFFSLFLSFIPSYKIIKIASIEFIFLKSSSSTTTTTTSLLKGKTAIVSSRMIVII